MRRKRNQNATAPAATATQVQDKPTDPPITKPELPEIFCAPVADEELPDAEMS